MPQHVKTLFVHRQKTEPKMEMRTKARTEFTDAHCHLNLFKNPQHEMAEARKKGVHLVIAAGGSDKDNNDILKLLEIDSVFAVIGIGPDFSTRDHSKVAEIGKIIKSSRKIVGIGEIGMDEKAMAENNIELQERIFRAQLGIARALYLPVVIHSRGRLDQVTRIMEEEKAGKALFHFFEGDEKQASELAQKGHLISIPPAMTGRRKRIINELSLNSIVVETDSPVVGKGPADVIGVCETIAKLKGVTLEEVAARTTENIRRLFYI